MSLIKWLIVMVAGVSLVSCKKFLDKKPNNSLVVPNTVSDLQRILDDDERMNYNTGSFGEASSDDYFLTTETYNTLQLLDKNRYTWTPADYTFQNDWSQAYAAIYPANLCLLRLPEIQKTPENESAWNNVKGSALFYRAYYHLQIAWLFALAYDDANADTDPGIVLRMGADFNAPSVRSSVKKSYEQILDDAKQAIPCLPDHPLHVLRPSKAAAYALLARAYLSMRKYDSAGKYANLGLSIKNELMDYNDPAHVDVNASLPFRFFNNETIFYTTMHKLYWLHSPLTGARIDTILYAAYDTNDIRKDAFFKPVVGYHAFKGTYSNELAFLFSGITTAELVLIRAESYARAANTVASLDDLNYLLQKRYRSSFTPLSAGTSEEIIARVLLERRKELVMRGLRWMDIKRLNKEGAGIVLQRKIDNQVISLSPDDKRYALPIPIDIILNAGIQQN